MLPKHSYKKENINPEQLTGLSDVMVRKASRRMQETTPLIKVAFNMLVGAWFDAYLFL